MTLSPRRWIDSEAKLEAMLAPTAPAQDDVALLARLLSRPTDERYPALALDPQRHKERTLAALLRRFAGFADQGPVLGAKVLRPVSRRWHGTP